ncbi:MAG: hypothetical protein KJO48_02635, partial [Ignavibacteria bacterium]|nr:hypothetical protein [Ignavibacteria bacterium]
FSFKPVEINPAGKIYSIKILYINYSYVCNSACCVSANANFIEEVGLYGGQVSRRNLMKKN